MTPETVDEREAIMNLAQRHIQSLPGQLSQADYIDLEQRLANVTDGSETRIVANGVALYAPGLARRVAPDIFKLADKDGLVPLGSLQEIAPGVFDHSGLMIYAHSYFRRSLSRLNTLNDPFLRVLAKLHRERSDLDIRLALDPDVVGLATSYMGSVELAYWWGPQFTDDLPKIEMGSVAHGATEEQREYYGLEKCDFLWYSEGAVGKDTSFACEEVVVVPSYGVGADMCGLRYAHSRMGPETGYPVHLDGAIRFYPADEMAARTELKLNDTGRGAQYVKLWRVDSPSPSDAVKPEERVTFERTHIIPVQSWKALLTHYYRDNSLVGEYLQAHTDEPEIPTPEMLSKPDPLNFLVPVRMHPSEGVHVCICYDKVVSDVTPGRFLIPTGSYGETQTAARPYVEADTLEVIKILKRRAHDVVVPSDMAWISIGDRTLNLPLFRHYGRNAYALTIETIRAIAEFTEAELRNKADRIIAYSVEFPYEELSLRYSVAGNVADIVAWQATDCALPPEATAKLSDWADNIKQTLMTLFEATAREIPVNTLLRNDGLLSFPRVPLKGDQWNFIGTTNGRAAITKRYFDTLKPEIQDLVNEGKLSVAPAIEILDSRCSGCGNSYPSCPCVKNLDGVSVEVKRLVAHEAYWTANPA